MLNKRYVFYNLTDRGVCCPHATPSSSHGVAEPGSWPQGGPDPTMGSGEQCLGATWGQRGQMGPCAPAHPTHMSKKPPRGCTSSARGTVATSNEPTHGATGARSPRGSLGTGWAKPLHPRSHPASPRCPPVLHSPPRFIPGAGRGVTPGAAWGAPRGLGEVPWCPGQQRGSAGSTEPPGTVPAEGGPRCPPVPSVPPPPLPGSGSQRRCGGTESGVRENESESPRRAFAFASPARSRGHRGAGPDAGLGARWRSRGRP